MYFVSLSNISSHYFKILCLRVLLVATKIVETKRCFYSYSTLTWYPGKLTTFILAVYEIEGLIENLIVLRDKTVDLSQFPTTSPSPQPNDYTNIDNSINNWKSILSTYRSQTGDLTYAFTNELKQYNDIVNSFYQYQQTQKDIADAGTTVQSLIKVLILIGNYNGGATEYMNPGYYAVRATNIVQTVLFISIQGTLRNYCDMGIRNQYQFSRYNTHICQDFSVDKWKYFQSFFQDVCAIHTGFDSSSDLSTFYGNICMSGKPVKTSTIPGGVESSGMNQTLYQFLQSNKAYLTFGASTGTTLSWTTDVTSSLTHITKFSNQFDEEIELGGNVEILAGGADQSKYTVSLASSYNVDVGQASSRIEKTSRTVIIDLGDDDKGTTFMKKYNYLFTKSLLLLLYVDDNFVVRITEDPVYGKLI